MARRGSNVAAGVKYWTEDDARAVVEGWRRSGLTVGAYARGRGIHPRRLSRWATRLEDAAEAEAPRFHPVQLLPGVAELEGGNGRIEIVLGEDVRVRVPAGFAALDLRRVLDVLQERP